MSIHRLKESLKQNLKVKGIFDTIFLENSTWWTINFFKKNHSLTLLENRKRKRNFDVKIH